MIRQYNKADLHLMYLIQTHYNQYFGFSHADYKLIPVSQAPLSVGSLGLGGTYLSWEPGGTSKRIRNRGMDRELRGEEVERRWRGGEERKGEETV